MLQYKICFLSFVLFSLTLTAYSQKNCADIKTGVFYYYPKNSSDIVRSERGIDFLKEITLNKKDSTLWKIDWINECTYSLKYISGNTKMAVETRDLLTDHKLLYKITTITNTFFIYESFVDKVSKTPFGSDTIFMDPQINYVSKEIFKPIKSEMELRKDKFSDTSAYAVLYFYRKGKLVGSGADCYISLDDNLVGISKNNAGFIIKLIRPGKYNFKALVNTLATTSEMEFVAGKRYYIECKIKFGYYNFNNAGKAELLLVDEAKGKEEFGNAY